MTPARLRVTIASFVPDPPHVQRRTGAPARPIARRNTSGPTPDPDGEVPALSPAGAEFIARFEGFSAELYDDAAVPPNATIGFGHVVHPGPVDGTEPPELKKGITRRQALALLQQDADAAAAAVRRCVTVPLEQHQFDALVSFTFNCGAGSLERSTLLAKLNAGRYDAVPAELKRWVRAGSTTLPGLVARRAAEGALFSRGVY